MRYAPDEAVDQLLDCWKRGDRDDEAWYRLLSGPMRRGSWQGIQRMTGQPPNDDDVGEVVYNAFKEFLELDPARIPKRNRSTPTPTTSWWTSCCGRSLKIDHSARCS
jgi:hypothetical protein